MTSLDQFYAEFASQRCKDCGKPVTKDDDSSPIANGHTGHERVCRPCRNRGDYELNDNGEWVNA